MSRWLEFIQNHPILVGIFATLVILFFMLESLRSGKKISPQSVGLLVTNENAKVIDLRDAKDFKEGHISGSTNVPFARFKDEVEALKKANQPLILVCKMGSTAGHAVQQLHTNNAYRLDGGIMNWKAQGLPLVKDKKTKLRKA